MTQNPVDMKWLRRNRTLQQVAANYRSRGYSVVPLDQPSDIPEDILDLQPDMIVRKGTETVVVEVKEAEGARDPLQLEGLAKAVERHSKYKLDFVWLGSTVPPSPTSERLRETVSQARLVARVSPQAALLLGWSAAEAALDVLLRAYASEEFEGTRKSFSPKAKVSLAESLGLISESLYETLSQAGDARNAVAHSPLSDVTPDFQRLVDALLNAAESLSSEQYVSPDQMADWFNENYMNPVEIVPFASSEGGYQYYAGGPYDAEDVLRERFPGAAADDIAEAVAVLEQDSTDWVRREDYLPKAP